MQQNQKSRKQDGVKFLLIDLFCGCGGTTEGAEKSGVVKVIAAVNHDPLAIKSHARNHRDVLHLTEDILVADTQRIKQVVEKWRRIYPAAKLILWASLECTNHSNAKGGLPRDADSRALAYGLFRYLEALNPDYLQIENVREFMAWGEIDKNGRPISKDKGRDYIRWIKAVEALGYVHDWRMLNAANFGGVTIRERYFACFRKPGLAFAWPQRTHAKSASKGDMFTDEMKPWRPVSEVLDFTDFGQSIFKRKKPLVDKTLKRILAGLRKFHTQSMIMVCNSPGYCTPVDNPCPTLTTVNSKAIVTPFVYQYNGASIGRSILDPCATVTTEQKLYLATPLLAAYYGNGNCSQVSSPCGTVPTHDRFAMITPWIDRDFKTGRSQSIYDPAGALLTVPKMNLCSAFLVPSNFDNLPRSIQDPAPTILASRKHINFATSWIVNPAYRSNGTSVSSPAPTVVASQRSYPLRKDSLSTAIIRWEVVDGDSQAMIELKNFMRENGIADVFMRMLKIAELKRIQGFPDTYELCGTKNDQKKFIGNSVETNVVAAWFRAMAQAC